MTLSTMIVLELHEVSLYIFISGLISTIILPVLFSSLFFPLMNSQSFLLYTPLHSYPTLSVKQFALLFYLYFFSQCCYNLFSGTVLLWFPILWLQSLSTTSHSCLLLCTSLVTVTLFADDTQVIFINISVTYDNMFFLYSTSFYA